MQRSLVVDSVQLFGDVSVIEIVVLEKLLTVRIRRVEHPDEDQNGDRHFRRQAQMNDVEAALNCRYDLVINPIQRLGFHRSLLVHVPHIQLYVEDFVEKCLELVDRVLEVTDHLIGELMAYFAHLSSQIDQFTDRQQNANNVADHAN